MVDIGDNQLGAGSMQAARVVVTDIAESLHCNRQAFQRIASQVMLDCGLRADKTTQCGERRRIAAGAEAGDVFGLGGDMRHVGRAGADVFRRDVTAAQAFQGFAHGFEQGGCLGGFRIADNHAFAAADRQAGNRILVGHAARQAQHIVDGDGFAGVVPHAAATHGRAEVGVVDSDDAFEAGFFFGNEDHLFVVVEIQFIKNEGTHAFGSVRIAFTRPGRAGYGFPLCLG